MHRLGEIKKIINDRKTKIIQMKTARDMFTSKYNELEESINVIRDNIDDYSKSIELLDLASSEAKVSVIEFLESIVSDALNFVFNMPYSFRILIKEEGRPSCDFFLVETVDGVESLQSPEESCGGGILDVIATVLKVSYACLYKNPGIKGPIILDEPSKMLSEEASAKYAEFLKKLCQKYNKQVLMITHNNTILNIADKQITIRK